MSSRVQGAARAFDPEGARRPSGDTKSLYRQLRPGPGKRRDEVVANQRSRLIAATIELVAERGYEGMTVSNIARLAGVSKASFYEQFSGKDECFVASCDTALRVVARVVLQGGSVAGEGRDRLRAGLSALADLIAAEPKGARLVLIDAPTATPAIRDHVSRRFGLLEALVLERLTSAGRGGLPKAVVAAIVRGIEHHARRCLGEGRPDRLRDLVDPLLDWGLGFSCEETSAVFAAHARPIRSRGRGGSACSDANGVRGPQGTRDLLLRASFQLAACEGYGRLTPARIRRTAGVSRRSFDENFDDATECFLAAVGSELGSAFDRALRSAGAGRPWNRSICIFFDRFAMSIARAPDLARLAFVESLDAGPAALKWRERIIAEWATALYDGAPAGGRPSSRIAEATVAGIWGFVADLAAAHRLHSLADHAPRLAFLVLGPALGTESAADVSEARQAVTAQTAGRL